MSVYRFLLDRGVPSDRLRMEAFGRFRPRYGDQNAADRRRNRRVDIVLDKRNGEWLKKIEKPPSPSPTAPTSTRTSASGWRSRPRSSRRTSPRCSPPCAAGSGKGTADMARKKKKGGGGGAGEGWLVTFRT